MVMVVVVIMVVMMTMGFLLFKMVWLVAVLYLADPRRGSGNLFKVKHACAYDAVKIHIGIIAFYNVCLRLQCADDGAHTLSLLRCHLGDLVKQHHIAELYLLYHEALYIVLSRFAPDKPLATGELALHAQRINDRNDAVKHRNGTLVILRKHGAYGRYGLRDRSRIAYAARLNHYVVETPGRGKLRKLFNKICLERAADAPVLERHKVAGTVRRTDHSPFLYECGIYVDLADVIHYYGESYAATVGKDAVEQRCLSTPEIAGKQQYRYFICNHITSVLLPQR